MKRRLWLVLLFSVLGCTPAQRGCFNPFRSDAEVESDNRKTQDMIDNVDKAFKSMRQLNEELKNAAGDNR